MQHDIVLLLNAANTRYLVGIFKRCTSSSQRAALLIQLLSTGAAKCNKTLRPSRPKNSLEVVAGGIQTAHRLQALRSPRLEELLEVGVVLWRLTESRWQPTKENGKTNELPTTIISNFTAKRSTLHPYFCPIHKHTQLQCLLS